MNASSVRARGFGFGIGHRAGALLFFVGVSAIVLGPHVLPATSISTHSYDAVSDGYLFMWNFWWTKHALGELQNPYWTALLNHPHGTSLVFHTFPLTYNLLSIPAQLARPGEAGLAIAMNGLGFGSFVLSAWGAYLLAHRVTGSRAGALIAGLAFSFTPFHFLNMTNLHKAAIEVLPFYVLAWLGLQDHPTPRRAAILAAALALAFYTSMEFALHLVIGSGLWLTAMLARRAVSGRFSAMLALAAVVFALFASPLLVAQGRVVLGGEGSAVDLADSAGRDNPALVSFVTPSRAHRVYGEALAFAGEYQRSDAGIRGMRSESSLSFSVLILAAVALVSAGRNQRLFWALGAGFALLLALGPNLRLTGGVNTSIPLPYALVAWLVPPLRASRDPTRFVPLAVLMLSILAAFGVRDVLERISRPGIRVVAGLAIGGAILFEFWPRTAPKVLPEVPAAYAEIAQTPGEFAVLDLMPEPFRLLGQTAHGRPITNIRISVPRSTAGRRVLFAERAFMDPSRILGGDAEGIAARVSQLRRDLAANAIRFVVFPQGGESRSRLALARRLGARIEVVDGLVVCELNRSRRALPGSPAES